VSAPAPAVAARAEWGDFLSEPPPNKTPDDHNNKLIKTYTYKTNAAANSAGAAAQPEEAGLCAAPSTVAPSTVLPNMPRGFGRNSEVCVLDSIPQSAIPAPAQVSKSQVTHACPYSPRPPPSGNSSAPRPHAPQRPAARLWALALAHTDYERAIASSMYALCRSGRVITSS
jgi:hypothetical protein